MLRLYIFLVVLIITIANFALEYIEHKDLKAGMPSPRKEYTFFGMLKVMWKERKERRAQKKADKKGCAEKQNLKFSGISLSEDRNASETNHQSHIKKEKRE